MKRTHCVDTQRSPEIGEEGGQAGVLVLVALVLLSLLSSSPFKLLDKMAGKAREPSDLALVRDSILSAKTILSLASIVTHFHRTEFDATEWHWTLISFPGWCRV